MTKSAFSIAADWWVSTQHLSPGRGGGIGYGKSCVIFSALAGRAFSDVLTGEAILPLGPKSFPARNPHKKKEAEESFIVKHDEHTLL